MAQTVEERLPNDVRDGGIAEGEWKPRPRTRVIGDIEWLARMSDKARAKAKGTIGLYIYACPADRRLLEALQMDDVTFQRLAVAANSDDELVEAVRANSPTIKAGTFSFTTRRLEQAGQPAQAPKPA
jgi:hypothetical protein